MRTITKIICALDLSNHSSAVAEYAACVARAFNASLTAVNVTPVLTQYLGVNVTARSIDRMARDLHSSAEENLQAFVREHFPGMDVNTVAISGYPADEIVSLAEKSEADLIIMGTHGHQGIDRILFGSVAESVVRNSHVPVITVRPLS